MRYCFPKKSHRVISIVGPIFGFCVVLVLLALEFSCVYLCFVDFSTLSLVYTLLCTALVVPISVLLAADSFFQLLAETREFELIEQGIMIRYLKRYEQFYAWDNFTQIGICNVNHTTRGPLRYDTVIRCVVGQEKYGPASGSRKWETFEYGVWHYKTVLRFAFSEDLLQEFREKTSHKIIDYTKDPRYIRY